MPMPNRAKVFPRGYSGGQAIKADTHSERSGDPEVARLWRQYTGPNNESNTWAFRKQVLATAKRLLSGSPNWFMLQDHNPMVLEYNYQFVIDTLRFIGTGRRRISIHAWPDLVSNFPVDGLDNVSERDDIAKQFDTLRLSTRVEAVLQLWCQRPHGFDDMICTLNILFGDLHLKVEQAPTSTTQH